MGPISKYKRMREIMAKGKPAEEVENMIHKVPKDTSKKTYAQGLAEGQKRGAKIERQRIIDMLLLTEDAIAKKTVENGAWELSAIIALIQVEDSPFV